MKCTDSHNEFETWHVQHHCMPAEQPHNRNLRKHRVSGSQFVYLLTTCTRRQLPLFRNHDLARIVVEEIIRSDRQLSSLTFAYVVMPDHVHWLFQLLHNQSLPSVVRSLKGRSAYRINRARGASGPIWQAAYHEHALRNDESLENCGNYIVANPVRAGLVSNVEDYPYWELMWERHRRSACCHRG